MSTSSGNKKVVKGSKLGRFLKFPIRLLSKARDFYVDGMNQCSSVVGYSDAMVVSGMPRSFSVSSTSSRTDEDFRALVRVASLKHMNKKIESELARRQVTRSCSASASVGVGVERIDEDEPSQFGERDVKVKQGLFPRSKTYANSRRTRLMF